MFDILQASFWSITYILIIIYSFREKLIAIPPIAIASNFAWETVSLLQDFLRHSPLSEVEIIIHIAWFSLDAVIVLIYLLRCKPVWFSKWIFACIYFAQSVCLLCIFSFVDNGMLLSCFCIDFIMALEWVFYLINKQMVFNSFMVLIAIAKLIGDCFAWLGYRDEHPLINAIGISVLIINAAYLIGAGCRAKREKR